MASGIHSFSETQQQWQQPKCYTSKNATELDLIWMSPETASLCRQVDVAELFQDHATLSIGIEPLGIDPHIGLAAAITGAI